MSGCISSETQFLPREGEVGVLKEGSFRSACSGVSCMYGWLRNTTVGGRAIGGAVGGERYVDEVSFHRLDSEHHIVQLSNMGPPKAHHSYVLLRQRGGEAVAFPVDINKISWTYVDKIAAEQGGIVETTSELFRRSGARTFVVTSRETLLRIFKDVSALPDARLEQMGGRFVVDSMSRTQMAKQVFDTAAKRSRPILDKSPVSLNVPKSAPSSGCPSVLPQGVKCTELPHASPDVHPQFEREVIYFEKYGCSHCRNIEGYVAAFQLSNLDFNFYYSSVIDWTERAVNLYPVETVPSFVVNRKYVIAIERSDKQTVEYALGLVSSLTRASAR